jgi:hypothetical protein
MATLSEIRQQYPQYSDMSDGALADALYKKFYSDMPRQDFDAKLGVQPAAPDVGMATAIGRGAAQGATLGGYDELRGVAEAGGVKPDEPMSLGSLLKGGYRMLTGSGNDAYEAGKNRTAAELKTAEQQYPLSTAAGNVGGTLASALGLGELSLGVRAARAGYGIGRTVLGSMLDGSILGGAQGALSADEGQRVSGAGTGALIGGIAGGAAPLAVSGATNVLRRFVTPFATTSQRTAAAQFLQQEGVPLTAGQATGSRALRYTESELGGDAANNVLQQQGEAFTDAAMRRAGGSGLATPDVLGALQTRLRGEFEGISNRNTMNVDQQFGQDIGNTLNRYGRLLEPQQRPIINNITDDLITRIQAGNGTLPGPEYQAIRSDLSLAAKSTSNQALSGAFRGIRNAMDNAMERSIPAGSQDAGRWAQLRRQYGNMKTMQRASLGGGEDAGLGIISPARLRMAAAAGNPEAFSTGANDYTQLAKAGQAVMTPLPQSGTAPRLRAQNLGMSFLPTIIGSTSGSAYGASQDGARGAIIGAILGAAAPRLAGRAIMSGTGQRYLANQRLPAGPLSPEARAVASLLLGRGVAAPIIDGQR